jgi:hypothetical protein
MGLGSKGGMRIFLPFSELRAQTFMAVPGAILVPTIGDYGYSKYLNERWEEGQTFINVEHDIVPTKEILESIWNCPEPLCVTAYEGDPPQVSYLACVKISDNFIKERRIDWDHLHFTDCDTQLWKSEPNHEDKWCYHGTVKHLR